MSWKYCRVSMWFLTGTGWGWACTMILLHNNVLMLTWILTACLCLFIKTMRLKIHASHGSFTEWFNHHHLNLGQFSFLIYGDNFNVPIITVWFIKTDSLVSPSGMIFKNLYQSNLVKIKYHVPTYFYFSAWTRSGVVCSFPVNSQT